jgi:hypothetical protein
MGEKRGVSRGMDTVGTKCLLTVHDAPKPLSINNPAECVQHCLGPNILCSDIGSRGKAVISKRPQKA